MNTKTQSEIMAMREGGHVLAQILQLLRQETAVGLTPKDMSLIAKDALHDARMKPAFLGYHGFPDVICISVNDQVQHSIPDSRPFEDGDVINYDFGVLHRGLITDGGITVGLGRLNKDSERLISGTKEALEAAVSMIRDGVRVGDVSATIEAVLRRHKLGIVRELVGHGVGHALHEDPEIPNYGRSGTGPVLKSGMTIAVEPIANLGKEGIKIEQDGWTLRTIDGSYSAQFEYTILVTQNGCEILTI